MPWKVSDVEKERARFVTEWESEDWDLSELCRQYGISRSTGYSMCPVRTLGAADKVSAPRL